MCRRVRSPGKATRYHLPHVALVAIVGGATEEPVGTRGRQSANDVALCHATLPSSNLEERMTPGPKAPTGRGGARSQRPKELVFVSFSHRDEEWARRLLVLL